MKIKNFMSATTLLATSMFVLAACDKQPAVDVLPEMSAERFEAHVRFLASDEMGGRDTGSAEYQVAADYVAQNFADMGLKPGGDNGSYFQQVNFRKTGLDVEKSSASMTLDGADVALTLGGNILVQGSANAAELMGSGDMVYVGYGLQLEEYGIDDFAGVDTEGKVLVRLWGTPDAVPADQASDVRHAKPRMGAKVIINLFGNQIKAGVGTWDVLKGYVSGGNLGWVGPNGKGKPLNKEPLPGGFVGPEVTDAILASIGLTVDTAGEGKSQAINGTLSLKAVSKYSDPISSPNVVGILEGSDPELKDQYVVISAHLDHIGDQCPNRTGKGKEGDSICNGAMDNATGTAAMLEAALAFTGRATPRRSIMFLSLTAEEKGLMGAEYFAYYPTVAKESLVANINLDMPVLLYDFADVVAFGGEHSSLGPIAARATARAGIGLADDPMPEEGLFTRSDHYRFVQQGIPSIFLVTGPSAVGDDMTLAPQEREGFKIAAGFLNSNYHNPSDDLDQPIIWSAGAKFALVNYLIINEVANADVEPRWNEGNAFGDQYAPGEPRAKTE